MYDLDKCAQFGQVCTILTSVYDFDKCARFGQVCIIWTSVYDLDKSVQEKFSHIFLRFVTKIERYL